MGFRWIFFFFFCGLLCAHGEKSGTYLTFGKKLWMPTNYTTQLIFYYRMNVQNVKVWRQFDWVVIKGINEMKQRKCSVGKYSEAYSNALNFFLMPTLLPSSKFQCLLTFESAINYDRSLTSFLPYCAYTQVAQMKL